MPSDRAPLQVMFVTDFPSPYQVELFDALVKRGRTIPRVAYLRTRSKSRQWCAPAMEHDWLDLERESADSARVMTWLDTSDLIVMCDYTNAWSRRLIRTLTSRRLPWCFWGERPGTRQLGKLGAWYRRWRLATLHRSRAPIWAIGHWAIQGYRREFGSQRPYYNVPYFSDLERFRPSSDRLAAKRSGCRFLFSGSLIPRKGVDLLAQAFMKLARHRPDVTLAFMGEGELESTLRKQTAPFADRVEFLGFRQWRDLPRIYHHADVLCVPSRYDGWGLVVPEGLAAGLPVIASDCVGAAVDLLQPGHNGWLARAGDVESLCRALEQAASVLPEARIRLMENAIASVAGHSLEIGAEKLERAALDSWSYWQDAPGSGGIRNESRAAARCDSR